MKDFFNVLSLHRDDLIEHGWDAAALDDVTMDDIASTIADGMMEYGSFWDALDSAAMAVGVKRTIKPQ